MFTRRFFLSLLSVSAFSATAFCEAPKPATGKTVRLLTIGNSFSHNAVHYLSDIAKANGDTLILREIIVGGASLELHWGKAEAFEANPDDPKGRYTSKKSLKEELTLQPWDVVTIQQASIKSHDASTYQPFAQKLADYVHRLAPQATLMMHETWEYRVDDPRFSAKTPAPGEPKSQDEMYAGLASAYQTVAKELAACRTLAQGRSSRGVEGGCPRDS